jgi:uncharacterized membrane protein YtjA (UPF0391 family)
MSALRRLRARKICWSREGKNNTGIRTREPNKRVDRRLQEYSDKLGAAGASRISDTVQETAQNVASSLAETAGEVKAQAEAAAFLCRGDLMLY